jgi:O-antigen/teichoic acid export membrane protein
MLALGSLTAADALGISVLATALAAGVGLVWLWRRVPAPARTAPPRIDGRHWHRAMLPMGATTVMRALDAQLPMLVLGAMVLAADLGTFRVALASMLLVNFPYTLVSVLTPPLTARLHAAGEHGRLQRLASAMTVATLLPTVAIALTLWLVGVPLITFLFGAEYAGAWLVLMVLALAGIANSFFGVTPAILFATGHERQVTSAFAAGLLVLAAGLLVAVPLFGITGAAGAIGAGVIVRELILWHFCQTRARIDPSPWAAPRHLWGS